MTRLTHVAGLAGANASRENQLSLFAFFLRTSLVCRLQIIWCAFIFLAACKTGKGLQQSPPTFDESNSSLTPFSAMAHRKQHTPKRCITQVRTNVNNGIYDQENVPTSEQNTPTKRQKMNNTGRNHPAWGRIVWFSSDTPEASPMKSNDNMTLNWPFSPINIYDMSRSPTPPDEQQVVGHATQNPEPQVSSSSNVDSACGSQTSDNETAPPSTTNSLRVRVIGTSAQSTQVPLSIEPQRPVGIPPPTTPDRPLASSSSSTQSALSKGEIMHTMISRSSLRSQLRFQYAHAPHPVDRFVTRIPIFRPLEESCLLIARIRFHYNRRGKNAEQHPARTYRYNRICNRTDKRREEKNIEIIQQEISELYSMAQASQTLARAAALQSIQLATTAKQRDCIIISSPTHHENYIEQAKTSEAFYGTQSLSATDFTRIMKYANEPPQIVLPTTTIKRLRMLFNMQFANPPIAIRSGSGPIPKLWQPPLHTNEYFTKLIHQMTPTGQPTPKPLIVVRVASIDGTFNEIQRAESVFDNQLIQYEQLRSLHTYLIAATLTYGPVAEHVAAAIDLPILQTEWYMHMMHITVFKQQQFLTACATPTIITIMLAARHENWEEVADVIGKFTPVRSTA